MYRLNKNARTVVHIATNRKKRCEQARTLKPLQSLGWREWVGCGESQQNMCSRTDPFPPWVAVNFQSGSTQTARKRPIPKAQKHRFYSKLIRKSRKVSKNPGDISRIGQQTNTGVRDSADIRVICTENPEKRSEFLDCKPEIGWQLSPAVVWSSWEIVYNPKKCIQSGGKECMTH